MIDLSVFDVIEGILHASRIFSATGIGTWPGTAKHLWSSSHLTIMTYNSHRNQCHKWRSSITTTKICKSWCISPKESKKTKLLHTKAHYVFPHVISPWLHHQHPWRRGIAATSQWHALTSRIVCVWLPAWMAPASGLAKGRDLGGTPCRNLAHEESFPVTLVWHIDT